MIAYAVEQPAYGQVRASNEFRKQGIGGTPASGQESSTQAAQADGGAGTVEEAISAGWDRPRSLPKRIALPLPLLYPEARIGTGSNVNLRYGRGNDHGVRF